ncbi:MAG: HupE/UreJ family protein [Methylovulum sp.]|nr:HupE/UreJ family protein [Methylovulum sp.]
MIQRIHLINLSGAGATALNSVRRWLTPLLAVGWILISGQALGHAFAPALLEIRETVPGEAVVRWKQPAIRVSGSGLSPILPPGCHERGKHSARTEDTGIVETWEIACPGGLLGQTVRVDGIAESRADVLLRLVLGDERSVRHVLTADAPSFVVPEREGKLDVLASYGRIGVGHILTGFDHLLFVLGLVLLVGGGRRLVWTVTAFTLGHSVTLALAVLGLVHVPQQPIEAGIAFSIYVLAVQLGPYRPSQPSLMARFPWLMAGVFGLLHGLGFAGALAEVGLPNGEIPLALFSFNVGIELGQLAFVGVVLLVWRGLRALPLRWPAPVGYAPAYVIGSLAVFWFLQRVTTSITGMVL